MMIQRNAKAATIGGLLLTCGVAAGLAFAFHTPTRMKGIEEPGTDVAALAPDWAPSDLESTIPYEMPPSDLTPPPWRHADGAGYYSHLQPDGSPTTMDAGVLDAGFAASYDEALPAEIASDRTSDREIASLDRGDDAAASAQAASEAAADVSAAAAAPAPQEPTPAAPASPVATLNS